MQICYYVQCILNVIYLHNPSLHLLGAAASVATVARANFANIKIIFAEDIHQLESELVDVLAIELEMKVTESHGEAY